MIEIKRDPKRVKFKFPLPAASGRQVLELQGAAKRYGEKVVYERVDCSIERGQRVALVGENGAGKSTLLKMLAGVLAPRERHTERSAMVSRCTTSPNTRQKP